MSISARGFLVAITNPKTIAFFTAFLPQFVDPALPAGHQLFVMCSVAIAMAMLTDCGWGVVAGAGRACFLQAVSTNWLLGRLSGAVLIGGGIWLSLVRRPGWRAARGRLLVEHALRMQKDRLAAVSQKRGRRPTT